MERYVRSYGWQNGGGLFIEGTATLTDTNVYQNEATYVCSLFEHFVTFHPSPRGVTRVLMVGRVAGDSASLARQR